jgi:hypothetical protein
VNLSSEYLIGLLSTAIVVAVPPGVVGAADWIIESATGRNVSTDSDGVTKLFRVCVCFDPHRKPFPFVSPQSRQRGDPSSSRAGSIASPHW